LYIKFLDKLNSKGLHKEVLKASYENCKVLFLVIRLSDLRYSKLDIFWDAIL
jgi:hypothetical protein